MLTDEVFCSRSIVLRFSPFLNFFNQFQIYTCFPCLFGFSFSRYLSPLAARFSNSFTRFLFACSLKCFLVSSFSAHFLTQCFCELWFLPPTSAGTRSIGSWWLQNGSWNRWRALIISLSRQLQPKVTQKQLKVHAQVHFSLKLPGSTKCSTPCSFEIELVLMLFIGSFYSNF